MDDSTFQAGKTSLHEFQSKSELPTYGYCWKESIISLKKGCKQLTVEIHGKLALSFLNCYLQMTGRSIYECNDKQKLLECTESMKDADHILLGNFFIDTKSMCYFLEKQFWLNEIQQIIGRLDHTLDAKKQLEDANAHYIDIINQSIYNQKETINKLADIFTSCENIHNMLSKVKNKSEEQHYYLSKVYHTVLQMEPWCTGFFSILYYTFTLNVCYVLTSTPCTAAARFWLFSITIGNFYLERCPMFWRRSDGDQQTGSDLDHYTDQELWRIMSVSLAIIVLVCSAISYFFRSTLMRYWKKISGQKIK